MFAADLVTHAVRDVASTPPSADLPLPDASASSCVSGLVLTGVGDDTRSRRVGIGHGVLKGLLVILSSWLRKDGHTRGLGVTIEMGSRVGPEGGVGSSLIRFATGSSGPVCIVSTWAGCGGVSTPYAWLCSTSNSLTTFATIVLTCTSLEPVAGSAACVLGGEVCSGLAGTSSSLVSSEGPG